MCHTGANSNKDYFTDDELRASASTPEKKPINWEHSSKNIGVIYASQFIDVATLKEEERANFGIASEVTNFIVCKGVIWKYKFPTEAREIKARHDKGQLFFSMETWFKEAECSDCHATFTKEKFYCEHLASRKASGSKTNRILKDCNFGGGGVVRNPADKGATSLSLGHENNLSLKNIETYKILSSLYDLDLSDFINYIILDKKD